MNLRITEIFYSLQGETRTVGQPTVFVRLTGCPLRCTYCDTTYAFTSGALSLEGIDPRVVKVMDLKAPSSAEVNKNHWQNLKYLTNQDQLKVVIGSRENYDWFCDVASSHHLYALCEVLLSPSHNVLPARTLADWILADRLPVRFQLQLHKYLWNNEPGH